MGAGYQCYEKNSGWAMCRQACAPGSVYPYDPPESQTPWTCKVLDSAPHPPTPAGTICSENSRDCRITTCCVQAGYQCYEKDSRWAMCREACAPGSVYFYDPPEYQTPWTCNVLSPTPSSARPSQIPTPAPTHAPTDGPTNSADHRTHFLEGSSS